MTPTEPPPLTRARTALAGLGDRLGAGQGAGRSEAVALLAIAAAGLVVLGLVVWGRPPTGLGGVVSDAGMADAAVEGTGLVLAPLTDEVVVHVAGLVRSPGLHRLPVGARVDDALEAAGGPLPEAWLEALNLARALTDGEQLLVPGQPSAEEAGAGLPGPGAGAASGAGAGGAVVGAGGGGIRADGTVDLNRATVAELETLPGVGPVLAQRLVDHREANGPFTAVGQLRDVRGIGEKTFQALADLVSV